MAQIANDYSSDGRFVVHHGDWRELLGQLPSDSVDLTVTSPPYCIGKSYEKNSTLEAFREEHREIIPRIVEVTKPGGSICWQVGYHVRNSALTPLDYIVHELFAAVPSVFLRNRLIWSFNSGLHCSRRLSGRHEVVLWYSKGEQYYFDLDPIRTPQLYPGKRHHKGKKRGKLSGNPLGKNPGDVWAIPQIKAASVEKTSHPCQFPVGLVQGLIRALCPPDGRVLDPFLGSGTTGAAAAIEGRRFVGSEIDDDYFQICVQRIQQAIDGNLRYRPYGKPLLRPNGKVARTPSEFVEFSKE
jgi:adenine-specific DNA-methyltransferase